jgi:hypothetical protein
MKRNGPIPRSAIERVMARVERDENTQCWIYTGSKNGQGYGVVQTGSTLDGTRCARLVHVVVWEEVNKSAVPEGKELDHTCRTRACCNPAHVEPVTHSVNMQRSAVVLRQLCPKGHPYDMLWGDNARRCSICRAETKSKSYFRNKEKRNG